ncbi:MAG: transporter substrate-binding domain-containing protein, partial [Caldilineaceae bacterium]|nr:transporter substrate-binding domain-containing protein [Caldilineaceae bacterium]
ALIREIANELGLNLELTNVAFDGLLGALQLGQIDVAIAALSITPERAALVDFTNVYYVGQDAIVAEPRSSIVVTTVDELAQYRVGVQRGSAYETWLRATLVATGEMAAENLFVYTTLPPAMRDLRQRAIDVVIMDSAPAESYVEGGSAKLVAEGLNKQRFAMAVPKGANLLRETINSALSELQAEERVAALTQQYLPLNASQVQPLPPEVQPAPTTAPLPSCIDGGLYLATGNTADPSIVVPTVLIAGQVFQKEIRVRNSGTCPWDGSYQLAYAGGNTPAAQMNGVAVPVQGSVAPNQEYLFYLNLTAPVNPGLYQATWELRNGQGVSFGERILVSVQVPTAPTPVPTPTPSSQPNIQFSVDRSYIRAGECVNFYWQVENVTAVFFYAQGEQQAGVGGIDQRSRCPTTTTTFELCVIERDNAQVVRQITVGVDNGLAPQIRRFDINPSGTINLRQCVTIAWEVAGQVSYLRIRRNGESLWDGAPLMGSF